MTLVQFGAGNIGRSFIGQLFAQAGYDVCFVDVDQELVAELNIARSYVVEVRDTPRQEIEIEGVRALHAGAKDRLVEEIAKADILGTAVGPRALPKVYPVIAEGLRARREAGGGPIDIILCENLRDAAEHAREGLAECLPEDYPLDELVGLVETSIGKMVPLITERDRKRDPLRVYAEAYNTLICDRSAFKQGVPDVHGLLPKDNMAAYVDRKLFIHNLGHATCAYVGRLQLPDATYMWEVMEDDDVRDAGRRAMWESGRALLKAYPEEFDEASIEHHIEDLLRRFANKALGDTVFRVGRDLRRKLAAEDRLIGALQTQTAHDIVPHATRLAVACALRFDATDEKGDPMDSDARILELVASQGALATLSDLADLSPMDALDASILWGCMDAVAWLGRVLRESPKVVPDYFEMKGV
ncbi:MAG: mannitol-1-phosphate 5-dehydrogenase [Armatimonadia bacterium]|nr:mannitol-1-phosphate 5-dehydrogenase [Armatimonadia bacterium]